MLCSATHPIDLSDGRPLAPGEVAEDIDTDDPHQRALILDGHLLVLEGSTPRKRMTEAQAKEVGTVLPDYDQADDAPPTTDTTKEKK